MSPIDVAGRRGHLIGSIRTTESAAELLHKFRGMPRSATTSANSFLQRLIGAMALDPAIYEEVEADRRAAVQAFIVVVLASLATGAGSRGFDGTTTADAIFISIASLLSWASWALLTFQVGVRLLPTS